MGMACPMLRFYAPLGAKVLSEFEMGNSFHQVPLHQDSHLVFQTHQGLYRMKTLFFGSTNSAGIFHNEVSKAYVGLEGCITIHDNILVYSRPQQADGGHAEEGQG